MKKAAAQVPTDPAKAWREWFVKNERDWSESLARVMKNEAVARSVGQDIHALLHGQQMMSESMAKNMAMLNLPTRADFVALGERVGRLEDAVARMEAALVQTRHALAPEVEHKPARTRKAPRRGETR